MNKKTIGKYIAGLAVTAAITAVSALVSKKVTKTLVEEAFDREEPNIIKKIAEKKLDDYMEREPYKSCIPLVEQTKELPTEEWTVTASDGVKLLGHFYKAKKEKRVIIAFHGWRSSWNRDFCAIIPFWHEHGSSVLLVEQRGQGNSGGDYMGFGLIERYDCLLWINKVNELYSDKPVYLAGVSMGASTVLMASGFELPENVHGIMADCGFTSAKDIFAYLAKNALHISYNIRRADIENLSKSKINIGAEDYSTATALKQNKIPVLFVHGTDDGFVPVSMTYENYKACIADKRLLIVPGADHAASYLTEKEKYEQTVIDFWKDFD